MARQRFAAAPADDGGQDDQAERCIVVRCDADTQLSEPNVTERIAACGPRAGVQQGKGGSGTTRTAALFGSTLSVKEGPLNFRCTLTSLLQ